MMEKDFGRVEDELARALKGMDRKTLRLLLNEAKALEHDCPGLTLAFVLRRAARRALRGRP